MDNDENIQYKFRLKKITFDEVPHTDTMITGIHSDLQVVDLDPRSSVPNFEVQDDKVNKDISYSDLYSKFNDEAKLIEDNIDLYDDLIKIEEAERKARQNHEMEFENCKKELDMYKKADIENRTKIEKLTRENENLKKSISSTYRTFNSEIQFKIQLLTEANNEITRLKNMRLFNYGAISQNLKCANCESYSGDSRNESSTSKRKRFESPERSSTKKECKSVTSKSHETGLQFEKDRKEVDKGLRHENTKNSHSTDLQNKDLKVDSSHRQISKDGKHDKETQISNLCTFCELYQNSKDFREINDMFSSLLPDSLKKSFSDYEQSQIVSLNNLKGKFVDEYFKSVSSLPSPTSESTPKRRDIPTEESPLDKSSKSRSSRTVSTSTSNSVHPRRSDPGRGFRNDKFDEKKVKNDFGHKHFAKLPKNCYNSRLKQKDLISLFRYRNEKIPFEEKKKLNLHKNDQKHIPKELL